MINKIISNLKNDLYINSIFVLTISIIAISASYYYFFTIDEMINIIKEEYILSIFVVLSSILHIYFYFKLKKYDILPFIPKLGKLPIKQSIIFFAIFEIIDYYSEDGFIGMIKLWYMYWLFGLLSLNLMYVFNYFKNYKFYNLNFK